VKTFSAACVLVWLFGRAAPVQAEPLAVPVPLLSPVPSGEASVSLGVRHEQSDVRSELAGFIGLEFPLDRVAAPRALLVAGNDTSAGTAAGEPSAAGRGDGADTPARDDESDDAGGRVIAPALGAELLAELARQAVAAAATAEREGARERALDGVASRARLSAALPELRLRAARSRDESLRLAPTTEDPYRFTLAGGNGLVLEGQATFRLNRLLFADEELGVERLRVERERGNERRQARVTARVLAWHRAVSRVRSAESPEERGRAELQRVEAEVELDVLTGGWFGRRVARLARGSAAVERRDPAPKPPAAPKPASKTKRSDVAAVHAHLDCTSGSATSASPCSPKPATDSRTF
jgi:hypothetical protein